VEVVLPELFERTWKFRMLPADGTVAALLDAVGNTDREIEYDRDHFPLSSCCLARLRSMRSKASCFMRGRLMARTLVFTELLERDANGLVRGSVRKAETALPELT
jgi:hypothetical protein